MSDLVKRLRPAYVEYGSADAARKLADTMREAADRIEALEAALTDLLEYEPSPASHARARAALSKGKTE